MNLKFSTLVNLHENQVFSLANHLLRDRGEAEDVTQETFLKLWENLPGVDLLKARPWLMRVARNACFDRLRKRSMERNHLAQNQDVEHAPCPEGSMAQEQRQAKMTEAIAALDEPYRSLVILRDIQQNSYREIELILDLTADQVKVYLYRARQRLSRIMEESL